MQDFWNEKYQDTQYIYGKEPNSFFKEYLKSFNRKLKVLLPCDGEGRNAVFAASLGHEVTAFDYSASGREKALKLAETSNVKIDYYLSDAFDFDYGSKDFDLIVFVFAHFPSDVRSMIHRSAAQALKPGGTVILEAFRPEQLKNTSGGPKNPNMLYTDVLLAEDFDVLEIQLLENAEVTLDEGPLHQGKADVIRLVAVRT